MGLKIAIQGELGSNSHMATLKMLGNEVKELSIAPCNISAEVMARVISRDVDAAVLPIENSLHGSVAEHYDL
jgi:prephenate dehydratase